MSSSPKGRKKAPGPSQHTTDELEDSRQVAGTPDHNRRHHGTAQSAQDKPLGRGGGDHRRVPATNPAAARRRHGLLRNSIPKPTRGALHRCLQRHGISRLPVGGDTSKRGRFAEAKIGFVTLTAVNCAWLRADLPCSWRLTDRISKFALVGFHQSAGKMEGAAFLRHVVDLPVCPAHRADGQRHEAAPFSWSGEGVVYDVSAMANSVAASYAMGER